jgi:polyhydroxybutyrate depolymerase
MWLAFGLAALAIAAAIAWALLLRPYVIEKPRLSGKFLQVALEHGGRPRSYGVYLSRPDAAARGVLVALHGSLGSGAEFRRWTGGTFDAMADRLGVAVIYPDGWKGHWNDCRRAGTYAAKAEAIDDVAFLEHVVRRVAGATHARIGVVGYSNGGFMALRWALEGSATLDGMVMIGAAVPADSNMACAVRRRPPPSLLLAGTEDAISPYQGGRVTLFGSDRGHVRSAEDSARWLAGAGASTPPSHVSPVSSPTIHRLVWFGGDQGSRAELVTLHGGGHTVPQPWTRFPHLLGRTIHSVDSAAYAAAAFRWNQLSMHPATPGR